MSELKNTPQSTSMLPARRAFLASLLGDPGSDPEAKARRIPAERIALLKDIAQRWEHRLPEGAIPSLRAGDACIGHAVCASVCPTGSLRTFEATAMQGLEFEASACFACGACVVVCPEQALRLEPQAPGAGRAKVERLTHHALRMCARCDDEFPGRGSDELCPSCRKDVDLFTHGFQPGAMQHERA